MADASCSRLKDRQKIGISVSETTVSAVLFAVLQFGKVISRKRREALQALELHSEYNACFFGQKEKITCRSIRRVALPE